MAYNLYFLPHPGAARVHFGQADHLDDVPDVIMDTSYHWWRMVYFDDVDNFAVYVRSQNLNENVDVLAGMATLDGGAMPSVGSSGTGQS